MDLQEHPRAETRVGERARQADHRALDDVGGGALDRGVDRRALAERPAARLLRLDLRQVDPPAEQRLDVAVLLGEGLLGVHEAFDRRVALEIGVDVALRLALLDAQVLREAVRADAVDDAEVDRLGLPAHRRVHPLHRHAEHLARGHRVDVGVVAEGLLQAFLLGHVGGQAQLDLGVVDA